MSINSNRGSRGDGLDPAYLQRLADAIIAGTAIIFASNEVSTYANLPDPNTLVVGTIYLVKTSTGVWLINRRSAGFYQVQTGGSPNQWVWLGDAPLIASQIGFTPDGDIAASNTQAAIVEVRDDSDLKISAKTSKATLSAKGDIYVATANATPDRLAAGANGYVLTSNAATVTGLQWQDPPVVSLAKGGTGSVNLGSIPNSVPFVNSVGTAIINESDLQYDANANALSIGTGAIATRGHLQIAGPVSANDPSIHLKPGADPTNVAGGDIWHSTTEQTIKTGNGLSDDALPVTLSGVFYAQTWKSTIQNTSSESSLFLQDDLTPIGTRILPAEFLSAGKTVQVTITGRIRTGEFSTPTLVITFYLASTSVSTVSISLPASLDNFFRFTGYIQYETADGGGLWLNGLFEIADFSGGQYGLKLALRDEAFSRYSASTIDVTATFNTADADNQIISQISIIEAKN